jgi:DNA-binding NarL/FixJ family response regulator
MHKIKILLADDHTILRQGIRALLEAESDIEVIEEAENGRDAVKKAMRLRPDIVIMDISMPILNGLDATRLIRKRVPTTRVLILSMHKSEEYVFQTLRAGASGYLVKDSVASDLISAIRAVNQGFSFLSPSISKIVLDEYIKRADQMKSDCDDILTQREREVLQLVGEGHANKEIANILCLSIKTVKRHKEKIRDKLDAPNNAYLVKYAIQKGLTESAL